MFETAEDVQQQGTIVPAREARCEACTEQVAGAKKELGAFVVAFGGMFGPEAAAQAAECWIGLVGYASPSTILDAHFWRQITIKAASRMAICYGSCRTTPNVVGATQQ